MASNLGGRGGEDEEDEEDVKEERELWEGGATQRDVKVQSSRSSSYSRRSSLLVSSILSEGVVDSCRRQVQVSSTGAGVVDRCCRVLSLFKFRKGGYVDCKVN